MELVNEFRVPVSVDQAWEVLTDVERVAPCIPGAQLLSVNGDEFTRGQGEGRPDHRAVQGQGIL